MLCVALVAFKNQPVDCGSTLLATAPPNGRPELTGTATGKKKTCKLSIKPFLEPFLQVSSCNSCSRLPWDSRPKGRVVGDLRAGLALRA